LKAKILARSEIFHYKDMSKKGEPAI